MHLPPAESKADVLGIRLRGLSEKPFRAEHERIWIRGFVMQNSPVCDEWQVVRQENACLCIARRKEHGTKLTTNFQ